LVAGRESLSYGELLQRSHQIAQLIAQQLSSGYEGVYVVANRSPDLVCSILGAIMYGVPIAIIDPRQGASRIAKIVENCGKSAGLVDMLGDRALSKAGCPKPCVRLDELVIEDADEALEPVSGREADTAVVLYTSGSTGEPKGVRISRGDLHCRLVAEQAWFELSDVDCILGVLPLSFDVGLTQLLGTLWAGARHVLLNSWLAKDILSGIDQYQAAGVALSPMVWKGLLNSKDPALVWSAINRLRYITLSGGTLHPEVLGEIAKRLHGTQLIKTYGQTEMFRIASLKLNDNLDKLLSVGQAYTGVELYTRNDDGTPCAKGEEGEVVARGMGMMQGYVGHEAGSVGQEVRTGDYGFVDDDGYLFIKGRRDEMVKVLDQRVFPDDVATSMCEILNVVDIIVLALKEKDDYYLVAVAENGRIPMEEQRIIRLLQQNLASHLVPRRVVEVERFPETVSGKLDKTQLRVMVEGILTAP